MLYATLTEDVPDSSSKREAARAAHMKRMSQMQDAGRIIISGPCLATDSPDSLSAGFWGSVIIAEFESLQAARAWADADPYVAGGVWSKVTVKPFHKGFPK
jgi:uncharacterized protein YciI